MTPVSFSLLTHAHNRYTTSCWCLSYYCEQSYQSPKTPGLFLRHQVATQKLIDINTILIEPSPLTNLHKFLIPLFHAIYYLKNIDKSIKQDLDQGLNNIIKIVVSHSNIICCFH
jgi:hypothetical protein